MLRGQKRWLLLWTFWFSALGHGQEVLAAAPRCPRCTTWETQKASALPEEGLFSLLQKQTPSKLAGRKAKYVLELKMWRQQVEIRRTERKWTGCHTLQRIGHTSRSSRDFVVDCGQTGPIGDQQRYFPSYERHAVLDSGLLPQHLLAWRPGGSHRLLRCCLSSKWPHLETYHTAFNYWPDGCWAQGAALSQDSLYCNTEEGLFSSGGHLNWGPIKVPFWKLQAEATSNNYGVLWTPHTS